MDADMEMHWSKDSPTQVIIGVPTGRVRMPRGRDKLEPDNAKAEAERILASASAEDQERVITRRTGERA